MVVECANSYAVYLIDKYTGAAVWKIFLMMRRAASALIMARVMAMNVRSADMLGGGTDNPATRIT